MAKKSGIENTKTNPELLMLGYLCIKDVKTLPEMVEILDRFNLSGPDIARICNAAEGSIRNARSEIKNKKRGKNDQRFA